MKIKVNVSDLKDTLKIASAVKPGDAAKGKGLGFKFTVSDGRVYVHSYNENGYVRVELPTLALEGDTPFVYPVDRVEAIQYMAGWVSIESSVEDKQYKYKYSTEEGATATIDTFDPDTFDTMETFIGEAPVSESHLIPKAVLIEALGVTTPYLLKKCETGQPFSTVQLFDASNPQWASGDGTMYAFDGVRACHFYSAAFKGKGFSVHEKHLSNLRAFLGKCHTTIKIQKGTTMTLAVDQVPDATGVLRDGSVFGWVHTASPHTKYRNLPLKYDKFVLKMPRELVLRNLKLAQSEMKGSAEKIRVLYSNKRLKFVTPNVETAEIDVVPMPLEEGGESGPEIAANANIRYLIELFSSMKGHEADLRIALVDNRPLFRTIETYYLNDDGKVVVSEGHECRVIHFTTAMD